MLSARTHGVCVTECYMLQVVNNYDLDVFNGDIGRVTALSEHLDGTLQPTATVEFQTGEFVATT